MPSIRLIVSETDGMSDDQLERPGLGLCGIGGTVADLGILSGRILHCTPGEILAQVIGFPVSTTTMPPSA